MRHYPTLAPPGDLTLHIEKLLNSSFSINLLCLKDLAHFSYIYPTKEPSLNQKLFKELQAIQRPVQSGTGQSIDVLYTIQL